MGLIWFLLGAIAIIGTGFWWLTIAERRVRGEMLADLKNINDIVVAAVDPDQFTNLTMTEEDAENPDYLRLRERLVAMHQVMGDEIGVVGFYALNAVGDEIRFIVDSADEGDPWHSPPGTVYRQPTDDILSVLKDNRPVVGGPYNDEYGSFYTAVAPLYDKQGRAVAYLATDITADAFDGRVRQAMLAPGLQVLALLLLYLVLFMVTGRLLEWRKRKNEQLRAAIESERAKTDFINMAAHQLKTPLTALKWSVEMLEASKPAGGWTKDEDEAFGQVVDATHHLDDLVAKLLNIGRIESGRLKIDSRPTDLKALAAEVVDELKAFAEKMRHKVTIESDPGLPRVNADPVLTREVYKNLLTNAIKYTPSGGIIHVKIKVVGKDVVSSVQDNGLGIPPHEQDRIFDKFYRASNVEDWQGGGTGLGLYFAKQVAELSGGRIWFESVEGSGSTFYFSLPLAVGKPQEGQGAIS